MNKIKKDKKVKCECYPNTPKEDCGCKVCHKNSSKILLKRIEKKIDEILEAMWKRME